MMIINDTYTLYALLVSNAFLLGAAAIAVLRLQNLVRNSKSFRNSSTGAAIQDENIDSEKITEIVNRRFSSLLKIVDERSERNRAVHSRKSGDLPYENAVRMAKHGASIDDLTRSCGLSKGEAQLIMRVHASANHTPASTIN